MFRVLVVDQDRETLDYFANLIPDHGGRVTLAVSGAEALDKVRETLPDLVIMDVRLPDRTGLETLAAIREIEPRLPVIILTQSGATGEAIEATKLGAFDYVLKPFKTPEMLKLIHMALETGHASRSPVAMDEEHFSSYNDALIGRSQPMQEIYKAIGRVASTESTVLIRGESGTGKELVARAIYQHSSRADKPFVVVNCVAIPETLLESELFGYEKGAFTGAVDRRIGKIEQAHGGTVFLDEIGDMALGVQAKILRLLQERSIERIGGRRPIPVDVRILAATNRDLEKAIGDGRFREDLYYRLNVVNLPLPPLRERPEDVPMLCDFFLNRLAKNLSVRNPGLTPDARQLLSQFNWPGNVRELANAMEKCLIFSRGRPIGREDVTSLILAGGRNIGNSPGMADENIRNWVRRAVAVGADNLLADLTDHVSKVAIAEALTLTGGNRSRAAKLLGTSRPSLLAKMDKYGLREKFPSDSG